MKLTKKMLLEDSDKFKNGKWKKGAHETYHSSLTSIVDEVKDYVIRNGYELDESEDAFKFLNGYSDIGFYDEGTTQKLHIALKKNGKQINRRLQVIIYHMGYSRDKHLELTMYIA